MVSGRPSTHALNRSFVCNFLSSSASFILCSCLAWLALFRSASSFRLPLPFISLGFHFHGRLPFPLLFLTPAVFAFFRPLQFWVLTTQPLFFLSALFTLPSPSDFRAAPSLLSSLRSFPFFPGWFPIPSFRFRLLSFAVRFLSPFPASLPQPLHRCFPHSRSLSIPFLWHPYFQPSVLSSFRSSVSSYSAFSLFLSASSLVRLAPAHSVPLRFFRRSGFLRFLRLLSHPLSSASAYSVLCLVSFRPSQLHSRSRSVGACLCFPLPLVHFFALGIRPLLLFPFGPFHFRL